MGGAKKPEREILSLHRGRLERKSTKNRSIIDENPPQIGLGASFGCPKAISSTSGRIPKMTLGAQTSPRSIFLRCWVDLGWFFVDFRKIFRLLSLAPRATKAQEQNLKKESRDPQCTSWFLRCAVASYCSHVFRNDVRTLQVQPFFVAYPQAHLVI